MRYAKQLTKADRDEIDLSADVEAVIRKGPIDVAHLRSSGCAVFTAADGRPFSEPETMNCPCGYWAAYWLKIDMLTGHSTYRCPKCGRDTVRY